MRPPRTRAVLFTALVFVGAHSGPTVPASVSAERGDHAQRGRVSTGPDEGESVSKALTEHLADQEDLLRVKKELLENTEGTRGNIRRMNELAKVHRETCQQRRKVARQEDEAERDDALSVAEAEERATREQVAAADSQVAAVNADIAESDADIAVTRAMLNALADPDQRAAVVKAEARLSESRILAALADEKAAEAAVKALEAQLAAAKQKFEAAKAQSKRVRAREAG